MTTRLKVATAMLGGIFGALLCVPPELVADASTGGLEHPSRWIFVLCLALAGAALLISRYCCSSRKH